MSTTSRKNKSPGGQPARRSARRGRGESLIAPTSNSWSTWQTWQTVRASQKLQDKVKDTAESVKEVAGDAKDAAKSFTDRFKQD